jgi:hypothetical protein
MDRRGFLAGGAALASLAGKAWAQVDDLRVAAREAWLYGLPLIETARLRSLAIGPRPRPGQPGFNTFAHSRLPATPDDRDFSGAEADVLYSSAWIHLGGEGARVIIPPSSGRYVCVSLFDMYGNAFEVHESRGAGDNGREIDLLGPPTRMGVGDYTALMPQMPHLLRPVIRAPGPWVWALARMHLESQQDLGPAHEFQDALDIRVKPSTPTPAASAPLDAAWNDYFFAVQKLIEENPPPREELEFFRRIAPLQLSMLGDFERARFADADLEAVTAGVNEAQALAVETHAAEAVDGWVWPKAELGAYGQDFLYRARTVLTLPASPPRPVIAPLRAIAPDGALTFPSDRHYRLTLPGPPPADGFWSLTLYEAAPDGRLFLARNPIGRHMLGGWTPGLARRDDGGIDIWIGQVDPGGAHSSNWLPAPAGGAFALILRAYAPGEALLDRRYRPPPVALLTPRAKR